MWGACRCVCVCGGVCVCVKGGEMPLKVPTTCLKGWHLCKTGSVQTWVIISSKMCQIHTTNLLVSFAHISKGKHMTKAFKVGLRVPVLTCVFCILNRLTKDKVCAILPQGCFLFSLNCSGKNKYVALGIRLLWTLRFPSTKFKKKWEEKYYGCTRAYI